MKHFVKSILYLNLSHMAFLLLLFFHNFYFCAFKICLFFEETFIIIKVAIFCTMQTYTRKGKKIHYEKKKEEKKECKIFFFCKFFYGRNAKCSPTIITLMNPIKSPLDSKPFI